MTLPINLDNINPDYPKTTQLTIPSLIFHDSTEKELEVINKLREELRLKLLILDATETFNLLKNHFQSYPNSKIKVSFLYNNVSLDITDPSNVAFHSVRENVAYALREKLNKDVLNQLKTNQLTSKNLDDCIESFLGQELFHQWKLGKIGLEKENLEKKLTLPFNENKKVKL